MKVHEIQGHFLAGAICSWEWLVATMTTAGQTKIIAVKNRSHKVFKLVFNSLLRSGLFLL